MDVMALLLIIEVKINFSLGFDNTDYQTNKLQNVHALRPSGTKFSAKGRCRPLFQIWGRSRTENSSKGLDFLVGH